MPKFMTMILSSLAAVLAGFSIAQPELVVILVLFKVIYLLVIGLLSFD